jgi:hypothetical protein
LHGKELEASATFLDDTRKALDRLQVYSRQVNESLADPRNPVPRAIPSGLDTAIAIVQDDQDVLEILGGKAEAASN